MLKIEEDMIRSEAKPVCYLCGTLGTSIYRALSDRLFGAPGKWTLKRCPNTECQLVWLDPMPIEEEIGKAYETYYTHANPSERPASLAIGLVKRLIFKPALFLLGVRKERDRISYLDNVRPGRLLEIGCGDGSRLAHLQSLGWQVEGQEIDPTAVDSARTNYNIKVHLGALEALGLGDDQYDAITLQHVIEHVHDPIRLLRECYRLLRPGGQLVVVTPNTDSFLHKRFGQNWLGLDPPRHLHLFNQETLIQTCQRAGFQNVMGQTTVANANYFALISWDLKTLRDVSVHGSTALVKRLRSVGLLLLELFAYWRDPYLGEECVLKARK